MRNEPTTAPSGAHNEESEIEGFCMEITDEKAAELGHLLRQGASMARELIGLHRLDARFGERLARDFEDALAELMPPAAKPAKTLADCLNLAISIVEGDRPKQRPCRCNAYSFLHRAKSGDCCGCESAPDCGHWIRIPDYYGTGDHSNVRYERAEK